MLYVHPFENTVVSQSIAEDSSLLGCDNCVIGQVITDILQALQSFQISAVPLWKPADSFVSALYI